MKKIIGVIGTANANNEETKIAEEIGAKIAKNGWILVNGGLTGVMEASSKGAKNENGEIIGILPNSDKLSANSYITIPIVTNMGHARNTIIAHTADILIAIGGEYGTLSEIAIAIKLGKKVIGINTWDIEGVEKVTSVKEAMEMCKILISKSEILNKF